MIWTASDYQALALAAGQIGTRAANLLLVLWSESGLDPHAAFRLPDGFPLAVGLNQITPPNARAMGITESERVGLLKLSPFDQLPYVARSIRSAAPRVTSYGDAGALYQCNFAPGTLRQGSADGVVMYQQGRDGDAYRLNSGLDVNHDGSITVGDLRAMLRKRAADGGFRKHLAALNSAVPGAGEPNIGDGAPGAGTLVVAAAAAGAAWVGWRLLSGKPIVPRGIL
jgi:hypothetical protein